MVWNRVEQIIYTAGVNKWHYSLVIEDCLLIQSHSINEKDMQFLC